jgi:hypothetical protein
MSELRLPDVTTAYAVLIGTGTYAGGDLEDLSGALRSFLLQTTDLLGLAFLC